MFHHKYRFWVQPYNASYHTELTLGQDVGSALLIGAPWEFDVPKCDHGVPGCSLENGTWIHTVRGSTFGRHTFGELNLVVSFFLCQIRTIYMKAMLHIRVYINLASCIHLHVTDITRIPNAFVHYHIYHMPDRFP